MKTCRFIYAILLCIVLLTACNNQEPEIVIEATISPVSAEEYKNIGATKDLNEPKQEDFKIFEFDFDTEHTNSVKERKIEMYKFENLKQAFSNEKIIVSWTNDHNEQITKEYNLSDLIKFN